MQTYVDIQIVLGLIFTVSALLSYFHKTPFPKDMTLIIICMVVYHISYYANYYYRNWVLKGRMFQFRTNLSKIPSNTNKNKELQSSQQVLSQQQKKATNLNEVDLYFFSQAELFSDIYEIEIQIIVGGKIEKTVSTRLIERQLVQKTQ